MGEELLLAEAQFGDEGGVMILPAEDGATADADLGGDRGVAVAADEQVDRLVLCWCQGGEVRVAGGDVVGGIAIQVQIQDCDMGRRAMALSRDLPPLTLPAASR